MPATGPRSLINGSACNAMRHSDCGQKPATSPSVTGQPTSNYPKAAVGRMPTAVAIDPANHTIYVTNSGDGTVSVLAE
jgi:hypothetical protein